MLLNIPDMLLVDGAQAVFEKSSTHELDIDFLDCSKKLGKPSLKILGLKKSKASRHRKF